MMKEYFNPRQVEAIKKYESKGWRFLILHGAVRCGKTTINNIFFLSELSRIKREANVKRPKFILAGASYASIVNNVTSELEELGVTIKRTKAGNLIILGCEVVLVYTGTTRGINKARGFTAYGAYVNEASLCEESVFQEINNRCSGRGSRILVDTNPDHPNHWLKKHYIDKAGSDILEVHFRLDDNSCFLTPAYIESLKATTPQGYRYDRAILGLWTIAQGRIFNNFEIKAFNPSLIIAEYEGTGMDFGWNDPSTLIQVKVKDDTAYIYGEFYQKEQEVDDIYALLKERGLLNAPHFRGDGGGLGKPYVEGLRKRGVNITPASKGKGSILAGISFLQGLKLVVHPECTALAEELERYSWKTTAGGSMEDVPEDVFNHVIDALRYATEALRRGEVAQVSQDFKDNILKLL